MSSTGSLPASGPSVVTSRPEEVFTEIMVPASEIEIFGSPATPLPIASFRPESVAESGAGLATELSGAALGSLPLPPRV